MAKKGIQIIEMDDEDDYSSSATPQPESTGVALFDNEPDTTKEAMKTFTNLKRNIYNERISHLYSASDEFMTCDCHEQIRKGRNIACGPDSDCINRLTNIECDDDQCSCGIDCQNQRFQNNEIADVSIFKTELKGYGMRANSNIPANTFIVEYKGEVVDNELYKQRKVDYDEEGVKHFYFMQIKDNEIIDATKMASIGRFCNHSCDPNAYVEKWVVNKRFRMGIFAKRRILRGEEITFDYNVDRYGAKPQTCHCGAANCLGVMGGKTQSESFRLLPHSISEALGVKANVEKKWIKEQKKIGVKVTKDNIDSNVNVEFVKSLEVTPLSTSDVSKVVRCLLQPDLDFIVLQKVFMRINEAEDYVEMVDRFSRLHGMQALGSVVKSLLAHSGSSTTFDHDEDQLLAHVVDMLNAWPALKSRNTVHSCKLDVYLKQASDKSEELEVQRDIEILLKNWSNLELVYRIPKKSENGHKHMPSPLDDRRARSSSTSSKLPTTPSGDLSIWEVESELGSNEKRMVDGALLPAGWEWAEDPNTGSKYYFNRDKDITQWEKPVGLPAGPKSSLPATPSASVSNAALTSNAGSKSTALDEEERKRRREREREKEEQLIRELELERQKQKRLEQERAELKLKTLKSIIEGAYESKEESPSEPQHSRFLLPSGSRKLNGSSISSIPSKPTISKRFSSTTSSASERESSPATSSKSLEKQWKTLFATVVPNVVNRYISDIGKDGVKRYSREIVSLLIEKEQKNKGPSAKPPKEFSSDKKSSIKKFVKQYMGKVVAHKSSKRTSSSVTDDDGDISKRTKA